MINGISFFFSANLKESDHFRIINKDIISIISEDIIDHLISLISFNDLINIRVRYFLVQGLATSRYVSQSHRLNTPIRFFFVNQLKKYLNFGLIKQNRFDLDSWKIHYN